MILFLDLASNRKGAINENYARELMELFTLGADRGAYTENDVRELARSLSGWDYDWSDELGVHNFHWDEADRWDPGNKTVFGKTGRWTWQDAARMVVEHPKHPSFFVAKLWSYFIPTAPDAGTAAKLEQLYVSSGYAIRPVLEAILCSPQLYTGPRMVKPPTVFVAGMLRARKRGITSNSWNWVLSGCGQVLYYPPDVSGWDDKRWLDTNTTLGRWEAVVMALEGDTADPEGGLPGRDPDRGAQAGARLLGRADADDRRRGRAQHLRPRRDRRRRRRLAARVAPERPAPADRRLPRLPDLLRTSPWPATATTSRRPRRAVACAASSRACPSRPAPASPAAPSSRAAAGSRCRCSAARCCRGWRSRRASPAPPPAPPRRCSSRSSCPAGSTRCRCWRRSATRATPSSGPRSSSPRGNGDAFTEDNRLQWHPNAAPLRDLHLAGKVSVMPAIGYDDANQSHFTSRHYWEVGELNPFGRIGWLGRYLDKHGADDNPLQGLSLDWSLAPALAASNVPVAAVSNPEYFSLDARDVWDGGVRTKLIDALAAQGEVATSDPELKSARRAAVQTVGLRGQLAGLQGTEAPWQATVAYPSTDGFARRLAVLAEMLDMGLPMQVVALDANGGYDTHDNQNGTLPDDIALFSQSLAAFQADLEARGLADRVLINVWSEFGRRPEENGSGTDHGAAGLSLLIGTRAKGTMVGEFPGLATLDEDDNLRHTTDFRAVYCSLLEQWMGVDAAGIIPGASGFARPALVR